MASKANGGSGAQSGDPVLGATSTASLPTGVAYCTSWGSYEGRLPEIPSDLSSGTLAHALWVSFGEQKWVSFAERQGVFARFCGDGPFGAPLPRLFCGGFLAKLW